MIDNKKYGLQIGLNDYDEKMKNNITFNISEETIKSRTNYHGIGK